MIAARVLPETRDPLGFLHYLRNVDWSKTPEVRSPVYDGHKLYDVRAELKSKSQTVSVPAGDFNTTKIEIHVLDNGTEMKDAHFFLYLANDSLRIPVLVEAVLPLPARASSLQRQSNGSGGARFWRSAGNDFVGFCITRRVALRVSITSLEESTICA